MGAGQFAVYTAFKAKDGVSPVFRNMTRGASGFENRLNRMQSSMGRVAGVVKGAVGVFAAVFAVSKIKEWGEMATKAASVELAAQEKLTQVLKNNAAIRAIGPKEYLKSSNSLIAMAAQMQQKGVIGDEVLVGGMQQLGSMGFDDKIIKKIMPVIADLAVQQKGYNVTIEDTQALAKGLGRAIGGNVGFLSRMGVVLDKNQKKQLQSMSATKRAEYLYSLLTKRVGGLNEKFAQTGEGAKVQFLNNWSDRLEDIGKRIIPIGGRLFKLLNKMTPSAATGITKFFDNVDYAIRKLQPVFDKMGEGFNYLTKHLVPELASSAPMLKFMFEGVLVPALTLVISAMNGLFVVIDNTYNFIKSNWIPILSVLAGVGGMLALKKAFDTVNGAIVWFNTLTMISGAEGVVAMSGFQKVSFILGGYTKALWGSVKAIGAQTLALLTNPWTWVAVGIAVVVAGAILIWKNWDKISAVMSSWFSNVQVWLSGFWIKCQDVFGKVGSFIKNNFVDILLTALGPIGWIIKGMITIGEKLGIIKGLGQGGNLGGSTVGGKYSAGRPVNPNYKQPIYNNASVQNSRMNGQIKVGVDINNNSMFPASSSLGLTGSHGLSLVPVR